MMTSNMRVALVEDRAVPAEAEVVRPWGRFRTVHAGSGFLMKQIDVFPGHRLSLQRHRHRAEHWVVVSGEAVVVVGTKEQTLTRDQSVYIPLGEVHRLENRSSETLVLIEVQVGDILEETDIERLSDDYGRQQ